MLFKRSEEAKVSKQEIEAKKAELHQDWVNTFTALMKELDPNFAIGRTDNRSNGN